MTYLTTKRLGIKLIHILNRLQVGRYEITCNVQNETYGIVLYNNANYGVYAGIFSIKHKYLSNALIHLIDTINKLNKM